MAWTDNMPTDRDLTCGGGPSPPCAGARGTVSRVNLPSAAAPGDDHPLLIPSDSRPQAAAGRTVSLFCSRSWILGAFRIDLWLELHRWRKPHVPPAQDDVPSSDPRLSL